jgi:hypothetical protein
MNANSGIAASDIYSVRRAESTPLRTRMEDRKIMVGATKNGNKTVGGWLPFVVAPSPLYKTMRVHGTLFTDFQSGTWDSKEEAIEVAKSRAKEKFAEDGESIEVVAGCHRCYDGRDPRHIANENGEVRCGTCQRKL